MFPSADEAKVYLTGLAETVPSISNVKAYAQIVQEKYLVRQLMGVAKDILQDAGDEPTPTCCWKTRSSASMRSAPARDSSALTTAFLQHGGDLTNLQKISGPDPTSTRASPPASAAGHGPHRPWPRRPHHPCGPPRYGQDQFALNIATRVAMQQKVPVAIFSLEMTKEQLTNRILSAEAGIDSQAFRTGALRAEDWERSGPCHRKAATTHRSIWTIPPASPSPR